MHGEKKVFLRPVPSGIGDHSLAAPLPATLPCAPACPAAPRAGGGGAAARAAAQEGADPGAGGDPGRAGREGAGATGEGAGGREGGAQWAGGAAVWGAAVWGSGGRCLADPSPSPLPPCPPHHPPTCLPTHPLPPTIGSQRGQLEAGGQLRRPSWNGSWFQMGTRLGGGVRQSAGAFRHFGGRGWFSGRRNTGPARTVLGGAGHWQPAC